MQSLQTEQVTTQIYLNDLVQKSFSTGLRAGGDKTGTGEGSQTDFTPEGWKSELVTLMPEHRPAALGHPQGGQEKKQGLDRTDSHNSLSLCSSELIPFVTLPGKVHKLTANSQHEEEKLYLPDTNRSKLSTTQICP